jgi:nitrate/TMAO reductase-like tetraheme cytochrome c subunit
MASSIFDRVHGPLAWACLGGAAVAALLLAYYLARRPPLTVGVKLLLLMGLGIFPIISAMSGNVVGFEASTERQFCGGCHVMKPYENDSLDPRSTSLAAMHARNDLFGDRNCYTCHADYGMYGTVVTKLAGLGHVYEYYGNGYHAMSLEEARDKIHIKKPFPNQTCMHCHSLTLPGWADEPEHQAIVESVERGEVSCASAGCHGPAHPFSKPKADGGTR